jgi:hypothetical protein
MTTRLLIAALVAFILVFAVAGWTVKGARWAFGR